MSWVLAKSLLKLREQLNAAYPNRSSFAGDSSGLQSCMELTAAAGVARMAFTIASLVVARIRVAVWAMGFTGVFPASAIAAQKVFPHRYGFQMLRVYTSRILAKVIDGKPFGNRPISYLIRDSVRSQQASIFTARADRTVPVLVLNAQPLPAFIRRPFFNFGPKPFGDWLAGINSRVSISSSQGVNLHRQVCVLVRPVHSLTRVFGPSCILPRKQVAYG